MANPLLAGYGLAGRVAMPLIPLVLSYRARKGHEDRGRLGERYGAPSRPRPGEPLVWVHAASVGETNAVLPLVRRLQERGFGVLLTTVTVTGAATAARGLPEGAIHQFAPLDVGPWIDRFLGHWRPVLALFVESEIWPETTAHLAAAGIPHVVVNGRLSDRSFGKWRRIGRIARGVFGRLSLCLAQSEADAERFRRLGARRVQAVGNLKFDAPAPDADPAALAALRKAVAGRPVWVAASTHDGEEAMVVAAHRQLAETIPDLLTVVVPRHPQRGADVLAEAGGGLGACLRSRGDDPGDCSLYIADTLGELGLFYRLAPVAFIGGSLVPHGGQNPIEAVRLGAAVVHGPHVQNFAAVYQQLDEAGGAVGIDGPDGLAPAIARLLRSPELRTRQADAAEAAIAPMTGALDLTLAGLDPYLREAERSRSGAAAPG